MSKNEENEVITSGKLSTSKVFSPAEIESFRNKIMELKKNAQNVLDFATTSFEREEPITEEDRTTNACLDINTLTVRRVQVVNANKTITNCDNALKRIENDTYGICFTTGEAIPKHMLLTSPFRTRKFLEGKEKNHARYVPWCGFSFIISAFTFVR